ncbi:MAG: hypothetical protein IPM57_03235 [Oligoflexia bacterium]|nr:hypothetical protein [Oligoflexia bacterium]
MAKCLKPLSFFIFLFFLAASSIAQKKEINSVPAFSCFQGNIEASCYQCEIDARLGGSKNPTPKQITQIYKAINNTGNSVGVDVRKKIDQKLREKIARLKLEAIYDISVNGLYLWPDLRNWPELSEKSLFNAKCFPDGRMQDYYSASKMAAQSMIKQKSKTQREEEQLEILKTRIKVVFQTRQKLNQLAELRTQVARAKIPFKDKSKVEENKKAILKIEKEILNENYLLKAPELFRELSVTDLNLDGVKTNRTIGPYAPNNLYEKIEDLFNKQFTELEMPTSSFELETTGAKVKSDINSYTNISDDVMNKFINKNKDVLLSSLKTQYSNAFSELHKDIKDVCANGVSDYYRHKALVEEAAKEVLNSKGSVSRYEIINGYKRICEDVYSKQERQDVMGLVESSVNESKVATGAGLVGLLVPVGGFLYGKAVKTSLGGIFLASNLQRASAIVQTGRAIKVGGEIAGGIFTTSVITAATTGYGSNSYDLELKNLALLIQQAKKADATEIDKLRAEVAELAIKAGESQAKLSDTGVKGLQGALLAGMTYFSITQVLKELSGDAQSILALKSTLNAWHAGKLKQEEFLEQIFRLKTKNFKKPIVKEEYDAWLEATKLKPNLLAQEVPHLTKATAAAASDVREALKTYKGVSGAAADDIFLSLLHFEPASIKSVTMLLQNAKNNPKELAELRSIIVASAASPEKQKYIQEFGQIGKLLNSDKAILKNWSDPTAINLIFSIRRRADLIVVTDKTLKGNYQLALEKVLKEDLGAQGFYNLCIKGGCPACIAK